MNKIKKLLLRINKPCNVHVAIATTRLELGKITKILRNNNINYRVIMTGTDASGLINGSYVQYEVMVQKENEEYAKHLIITNGKN